MRVFETYAALEAALALDPAAPGSFRFLRSYGPAGFRCASCGKAKRFPMKGGGTGYGVHREPDGSESMHCYSCCSKRERADLIARGKGTLYLSGIPVFGMEADGKGRRVGDWTGGLSFPVSSYWTGRHNMAGRTHFVRFKGPDGREWSGRTIGDNTQICHVRRLGGRA